MEKRIYYYDTDSGGVVYYANYLKYLEEARTEFLELKGLTIKILHEQGFLFAVRKCNVTYKLPARYADTIICDAVLNKITAAQMFFTQNIYDKLTNRVLVVAEVVLVCLGVDFKPVAIPDIIRKKLE